MGQIFNTEGPLMSFLGKMADLVWLNILTLICCIPIITIGASMTAMYTVTIKMTNKEEGYITQGFFKAFKKNFRQSTIIWLITIVLALIFYGDYRIITFMEFDFPKVLIILLIAVLFIFYCTYMYVFPVLARYENSIKNIIKNSFLLSVSNLPRTILIIALQFVPWVLLFYAPVVLPFVFLFGLSSVAYVSSLLFMHIFKKLEESGQAEAIVEEADNKEINEIDYKAEN